MSAYLTPAQAARSIGCAPEDLLHEVETGMLRGRITDSGEFLLRVGPPAIRYAGLVIGRLVVAMLAVLPTWASGQKVRPSTAGLTKPGTTNPETAAGRLQPNGTAINGPTSLCRPRRARGFQPPAPPPIAENTFGRNPSPNRLRPSP
jgi:hypothetical protein